MSSQTKEMINKYITIFRNKIAFILKDDVTIKCSIYPYSDGAIAIFSFSFAGVGNTEYKSESSTLEEAAQKANVKVPEVSSKCKVIFDGNRIIEIKPYDEKAWSADFASDLVQHLIDAMMSKK